MIYIRNMRLHAFHGVLPQECEVGNDYIINLSVDYPINKAGETDNVADTMSYADAADIIYKEMAVQSNLLENVVMRIARSILRAYPQAKEVTVDMMKVAPPMKADCDGAGVAVTVRQTDMA